jgi:quercetin dioxygenase-like cupin family protein
MYKATLVPFVCAASIFWSPAMAQLAGVNRTPLKSMEFPEGYTTTSGITEIAPHKSTGRHTHPGIDIGYVVEGEMVLRIDGMPEQILKAGEPYLIPAGAPHDVFNVTDKPMRAFGVFVVERGKALVSPVDDPFQKCSVSNTVRDGRCSDSRDRGVYRRTQ